MSGLADINALADNMVQGVAVSSTIHLVFNRGSLSSVISKGNLMNGAKIGAAAHVYQNLLREPVRSILNKVGL
jgi:hypothetical protein